MKCSSFQSSKSFWSTIRACSAAALFLLSCSTLALAKPPARKKPTPRPKPASRVATPRNAPVRSTFRMIRVDRTIKPDASIESFLRPYRKRLQKRMARVLTTVHKGFKRKRPESSLGNLVADLCLARLRYIGRTIDVFITNLGGIRNDLPAGKITLRDIYEILPFENQVVVARIKGSRLLEIFHRMAGKGGEPVAGARLLIQPKARRASQILIAGKPLQPNKYYNLGTSDYLSRTGWMAPYLRGSKLVFTDTFLRDAVIWGLRYNITTLAPRLDGRIRLAPSASLPVWSLWYPSLNIQRIVKLRKPPTKPSSAPASRPTSKPSSSLSLPRDIRSKLP